MKVKTYTVVVVLVISLSGCIFTDYPEDSVVDLDFYGDISDPKEGDLRIEAWISSRSSGTDVRVDNFSVIGYSSEGEAIFLKNKGTYNTTEEIKINISHPQRPKYILFSSPDIWSNRNVRIQYLTKGSDGYYGQNWTNTGDTLPLNVRNDVLNRTPQ